MNVRHTCRRAGGAWPRYGLLLALVVLPLHVDAVADVRILIDVSGSMQQNDPANLRVPALKLVSELLPAGTEVGVWLFAEDVAELLPVAPVDAEWRERARHASATIHSRGRFTDIESALAAATADWREPSVPNQRHVVLLTDGVVDVADGSAESAASRARIVSTRLERLLDQGAQIHAIALSANVDRELLDTLTSASGGWLEAASDAAALQRTFLHMLEASAPPVTVPLVGNGFDLDAAVTELTLLAFRAAGEETRLNAPDGSVLTAASVRPDLRWRSEAGYDLVTVTAPQAGHWRFDGASDPDNRAVVVTDLALSLEPFPRSLLASEAAGLRVRLTERGVPVSRLELLEVVTASAGVAAEDAAANAPATTALGLDRTAAAFTADSITSGLAPGDYTLTVTLDSGTFKRELHQQLRVAADPVTLHVTPDAARGAVTVAIAIDDAIDGKRVRAAGLRGYVTATDADGTMQAAVVQPGHDGSAAVTLAATANGAHGIMAQLYVTLDDGRVLALTPPAQTVSLNVPGPALVAAPPPPASFSWPRFTLYTLGANLTVGCACALLWWIVGRRRALPRVAALATEVVPA